MGDTVPDHGNITFAKLIREARAERGWTQAHLAHRARVSLRLITRYERGGATSPERDQVRSVCRALDINPTAAWMSLGYFTADEMAQAA